MSIIASGGLKGLSDVTALLAVESDGVIGAITGRAIYEGTLDLAEAIALTESNQVGLAKRIIPCLDVDGVGLSKVFNLRISVMRVILLKSAADTIKRVPMRLPFWISRPVTKIEKRHMRRCLVWRVRCLFL